MESERTAPRADGRRYVMDLKPGVGVRAAGDPAFEDFAHTDRLDNFTVMEVTLKSRCHGHQMEGLAYPITPIGMHYLLIHYDIPQIDESTYRLNVRGLVDKPLSLDMQDIRSRPKVTMPVTMECAGNGRLNQKFRLWPHVPWNNEAIGTAEWAGTPLRGVLEAAGLKDDAVDVVFTGLDKGIQGQQVQYFQRGLSVEQAMAEEVFLAYEINGQSLPPQHGFPLRLIVPGWLGMTNVKWLDSIEVIPTKFAGSQMMWYSFATNDDDPDRIPCTYMRVRSLMIPPGIPDFFTRYRYLDESPAVELRGRAWAGKSSIHSVEVSTDGGATWAPAKLGVPVGKFAWVEWSFTWEKPTRGRHVLRVRATDADGNKQLDDDSAHDYYAMDVTKPQYVDVVVLPAGALTPGFAVGVPIQFPTL
jgi:DMSO/TMAO reductase YedYZ molybdopterin-dependent catalytic subunit